MTDGAGEFVFDGRRADDWEPAPGLGEHNGYVLGELLGLPDGALAELEEKGIIGTKPVGA